VPTPIDALTEQFVQFIATLYVEFQHAKQRCIDATPEGYEPAAYDLQAIQWTHEQGVTISILIEVHRIGAADAAATN
jgi:hypothetical protein